MNTKLITPLISYIVALNVNNPLAVSNLFADQCKFTDGALRVDEKPDMIASIPEEVYKIFLQLFNRYTFKATIEEIYDHSMVYDVYLNNRKYPCIGAAWINKEGKLTEYVIRPR
jgi:hypothetical protein